MTWLGKIKDRISHSAPAVYLVNKSKRTHVPGFRGIPLFDVINFFFREVRTVGMTERASSIAFNFVMAIPPAIIFLFTLIPFLPISNAFEQSLYSLIRDAVPGEKIIPPLSISSLISSIIPGMDSYRLVLSSPFIFSSSAIMGIMRSFDKTYAGFRKRTMIQKRTAALKITFVLFAFIFISILLLVAQGAVLKWLGIRNQTLQYFIINFRWVVIIFLFFASISYIYRHAPAVEKKWRMFNPGSLLASFLMLICTGFFSWWVSHFGRYNQLYGSIGSILILMVLIYFNSLVLLIGFELNVSITSLKKIADERDNMPAGGEVKSG